MKLIEVWIEYRALMNRAEQLETTRRMLDSVEDQFGSSDERIECFWVVSDAIDVELEDTLQKVSVLIHKLSEKDAKELAWKREFDEMMKGGIK